MAWKDIHRPIQIPKIGSNFIFYAASFNKTELMIGFGRNRTNSRGYYCQSREYAQVVKAEQHQLEKIYPHQELPYLLPIQTVLYDDTRHTVICIRDRVNSLATIDKIQPNHFIQFPNLKEEFTKFFNQTRASQTKPDIIDPRNLVLSTHGHLVLLDQNALINPENRGAYNMAIRMQKALGYMSAGDTTFKDAYNLILNGEVNTWS